MTEAELAALADEIVARIKGPGAKTPRQKPGSVSGTSVSRAGVIPLPVGRAATAPQLDRTAQDIAWRGPSVMKAAWTEAQGARRVADFVDHTLLKPEATAAEIRKLCAEAREHRFAAVCINPVWVEQCAALLKGGEVAVCTVIGFPFGASTAKVKALEAADAVSRGATEVDMVAAIGRIKGGEWAAVEDDMRAVVESAGRALVKVIIESAALSQDEIIKTCALAKEAGADFVKTSTGFHPAGGASARAVRLMRLVVGDDLGVKASGGVRDCKTALAMIAAGASRIGTSSGVGFATCLGPGPLPLAELLKRPADHAHGCTSGSCATAAGGAAQPY